MTRSLKLNTLAVAVSLLAGSQSAQALTPWADGLPEVKIFTSGGAAQDRAIEEAIKFGLAEEGTLDVFQDVDGSNKGRRFLGYYFTGKNTLTNGLAGKRIYIAKRSLGAAGYGIAPLAGNIGLDNLDISLASSNGTLGSSLAGAWQADGAQRWKADITNNGSNAGQAAWSNYLVQNQLSDGGFTGVDGPALLQPGTDNYPEQVREPSTGAVTANWRTDLTGADLAANDIARIPTGGLVYGIGVPLDFYKVLQVAQARSGQLPEDVLTTNLGKYDDEKYLPTLSRNFLASLLAGKIKDWGDVKFVDNNGTPNDPGDDFTVALTDASVLADADVAAPYRTKVFIGRRNKGAAIGSVGYAKLLGFPYVEGASAPFAANNLSFLDTGPSAPIAKAPGGGRGTDTLLTDWQNGTNSSGFNPSLKKYWGFAVHGGDRNANTAQPWRYVRVDGAAPTIANVANGSYAYWAEGEVLIRPAAEIGADKVAALEAFASALGNVAVAKNVNTNAILPFGQSGVFATTKTDPSAFVSIPFDALNPIVPLSHDAGGFTSLGVAPVAFNNGVANPDFGGTTNTVIQLK